MIRKTMSLTGLASKLAIAGVAALTIGAQAMAQTVKITTKEPIAVLPLWFASPHTPILAKGSRWWRNFQCMSMTDADGRFEFVWPWTGEFDLTMQREGAAEQPLGQASCGQITLMTPK